MECNVYLGGPSQFELRGAILVYAGGNMSGGTSPRGTMSRAAKRALRDWGQPRRSQHPS